MTRLLDEHWEDCDHCGGSGRDESTWDGRCQMCEGGMVLVREFDDDDEEERE